VVTDPYGHPFLSEQAKDLDPDSLEAHAELAEDLLGITSLSLSEDQLESARRAVVRQINLQVSLPEDFALVQSESKGDQSVEYRGTNIQAGVNPIDPIAERIADSLAGAQNWGAVRSVRGP
jgi:hypothetical protein